MKLGSLTTRAANAVVDTATGVVGNTIYPESEYGLAALLFTRIAQVERETSPRDRAYFLDLMRTCLATVRSRDEAP